MRITIDPDGNMQFRALPPVCADSLLRLEEFIDAEDPEVRDRLIPKTFKGAEEQSQWERYAVPELEHLFAGRLEIIQKDLESMREDEGMTFSVIIPGAHRAAWLSALNAARLSIFIDSEMSAEELELEPGELGDADQDVALLRIHMLAFMQELILQATGEQ